MSQPEESTLFICYCNEHDEGFLFDENLLEKPDHDDCHTRVWHFCLDEPEESLGELFRDMQQWFDSMNGFYLAHILCPFDNATPEQRRRLDAKFERLTKIVGYVPEEDEEESEEDDPEAEAAKPEWLKRMLHVCYCNTCGEGVTYDEDVYTIPKEHEDCSTRLYQFDLTADPEKLKREFQTMVGLFDCAMDGFSVLSLAPRRRASKKTIERLRDKFDELLALVEYPERPRRYRDETLNFNWCSEHKEGLMFDGHWTEDRPSEHSKCPGVIWTYVFDTDSKDFMVREFENMLESFGPEKLSDVKPFEGVTPEKEARILEKFARLKEIVEYGKQE